jgi:hypothetical protein
VLVYTLVHFGQAGYVLTFLPALVILLARVLLAALARVAERVPSAPVRAALAATAVTLIVLANGAFFVSARPLTRDFDTRKSAWRQAAEHDAFDWIFSRTAAALREHEEVMATFVAAIRGLYPPEDTAIITELGNARSYPWLRHAMFYLPGYAIYELRVGDVTPGYYSPRLATAMTPLTHSEVELPVNVKRLVWFVDYWSPATERPPGLMEIEIPHGRYLLHPRPDALTSRCSTATTCASSSPPPCLSPCSSRGSVSWPAPPAFPSTTRGSTCTSPATWPRARASPTTRGGQSPAPRRRCGHCSSRPA